MNVLRDNSVDIDTYPQAQPNESSNSPILEITLGDLHANAQKFLYFLVREGIFVICKDEYMKLSQICNLTPEKLTILLLMDFRDILFNDVQVCNIAKLRLVGDELADWGNNDYFILKILEKLVVSNVQLEILLSNHGAEFIDIYERMLLLQNPPPQFEGKGKIMSLQRMGELITNNLVDIKEITNIVQQCYYPNVKLCSYSLIQKETQQPQVFVFTHAHVGLETIKALANLYGVPYDDSTASKLCSTIDSINSLFVPARDSQLIVQQMGSITTGWENTSTENPLVRIVWHIGFDDADLPAEHNGYKLSSVNGHAGHGKVSVNLKDTVHNLDNQLGKGEDSKHSHHNGEYSVMYLYK